MKDIRQKIVSLLKSGYCVPQIARIAKELKEPSTTLHYNIKQLEKESKIVAYKAVFDHKQIEEGLCNYVLITLSPDEYTNPEKIAHELAKFPQIESVDIITGDWEMIIKVRSKDNDEFYQFVKTVLSRKGIIKTKTLMSLKQVKSEFVKIG